MGAGVSMVGETARHADEATLAGRGPASYAAAPRRLCSHLD